MMLLAAAETHAYDLETGGLYYNITDIASLEVEVTFGDKQYSGDIVIPDKIDYNGKTLSVKSIGKNAFKGCKGVKSIDFGDSVTVIGWSAFEKCDGLTELTIPATIQSIDVYAFDKCASLTDITIDRSDKTIVFNELRPFSDCPVKKFYLGRSYDYEPHEGKWNRFSMFTYLGSTLEEITIGPDCGGIYGRLDRNEGGFDNCRVLRSVIFQDGEENFLGEYNLFDDCDNLQTLYLGRNIVTSTTLYPPIVSLEEARFETVTIGKYVTEITSRHFAYCENLKSIVIPDNIKSIGKEAFMGCKSLASVSLNKNITEISESCFSGCSSLAGISIPENVTKIGHWAFSSCSSLTSIDIPQNVTEIGAGVFEHCDGITSVYCRGSEPCKLSDNAFETSVYLGSTLYVPAGAAGKYQAADGWKNFFNIKEFDPTGIASAQADGTGSIKAENGRIVVENIRGRVTVYSTSGAEIKRIDADGGRAEITVPAGGVYIVKAGGMTARLGM